MNRSCAAAVTAIAVLLVCVFVPAATTAQTPRPPLAPGWNEFKYAPPSDSEKMAVVPPFQTIPIPDDEVDIRNIGNAELALSYWNADESPGAWQTITIAPGQSFPIKCHKCSKTVSISFHDGKQNKEFPISLGGEYTISWSSAQNVWVFNSTPQRYRIVPQDNAINPFMPGRVI